MELPDTFPAVIRELAQNGHMTKSGNRASVALAAKNDGRCALTILFKRRPSEEDMREVEQVISGTVNVVRGPTVLDPNCADEMVDFLKRSER